MVITQHTAPQTDTFDGATNLDITYNLTSGGTDVMLVLAVGVESGQTINSVTWDEGGAAPQTMLVGRNELGEDQRAAIFFLKNPTTRGSATLRIVLAFAAKTITFTKAYAGVGTIQNGIGQSASSGNPSLSPTTAVGSFAVSCTSNEGTTITVPGDQVEIGNTSNGINSAASHRTRTGATTTIDYTQADTGKKFTHAAVEMTEAAAVGGFAHSQAVVIG